MSLPKSRSHSLEDLYYYCLTTTRSKSNYHFLLFRSNNKTKTNFSSIIKKNIGFCHFKFTKEAEVHPQTLKGH